MAQRLWAGCCVHVNLGPSKIPNIYYNKICCPKLLHAQLCLEAFSDPYLELLQAVWGIHQTNLMDSANSLQQLHGKAAPPGQAGNEMRNQEEIAGSLPIWLTKEFAISYPKPVLANAKH